MKKTIYTSNKFFIIPDSKLKDGFYPEYCNWYNFGNEGHKIFALKDYGKQTIMFVPVITFYQGGADISYILDMQGMNDLKAFIYNWASPYLNKRNGKEKERAYYNDFLFQELNAPYDEGQKDEFTPFEIDEKTFYKILGNKDILFEKDFNAIFEALTKYYIEKELPLIEKEMEEIKETFCFPEFKIWDDRGKIVKIALN